MTAFGDSTFYVALLIARDKLHAKARDVAQSYCEPIVTMEYVLIEVANHLSRTAPQWATFGQFLADIKADLNTKPVQSSHELWERGTELYLRVRTRNGRARF